MYNICVCISLKCRLFSSNMSNYSVIANSTDIVFDPFYLFVFDWIKLFSTVFVSSAFILGMPGNILVVLVHIGIKDKCVTDWMIFYLAVCDLLSLIVLPSFVCQLLGYWSIGFPDILCKLHLWNSNSVSMCSYLFCACTAMERFVKVCLSRDLFTIRQAELIWVPICAVCYGVGILSFLTVGNNPNGHCMVDLEQMALSAIAFGSVMVTALVASVIMTFCYICIGVYLLRKMQELTKSKTNDSFAKSYKSTIQKTKMLAIVTVVFLISANAPYITTFTLMLNPVTEEPAISLIFLLTMLFCVNNFFNPYLYLVMSTSFRRRALAVLRPLCCCCMSKYAVTDESTVVGETKSTKVSD